MDNGAGGFIDDLEDEEEHDDAFDAALALDLVDCREFSELRDCKEVGDGDVRGRALSFVSGPPFTW